MFGLASLEVSGLAGLTKKTYFAAVSGICWGSCASKDNFRATGVVANSGTLEASPERSRNVGVFGFRRLGCPYIDMKKGWFAQISQRLVGLTGCSTCPLENWAFGAYDECMAFCCLPSLLGLRAL